MTILVGVPSEDARLYLPQLLGRIFTSAAVTDTGASEWNPTFSFFRIGCGGFELPGPGPRTPDPALRMLSGALVQDLDCIVDPTRPLIDQRYSGDELRYTEKALDATDFAFVAPSTVRVHCFLDFSEGNGTPDMEYYELGIYSDHPTEAGEYLLWAYCTFPLQTKTTGIQLSNYVNISF